MNQDNMIEMIARICHEANRAYSVALGDRSHAEWLEAPAWQRESARAGVRAHLAADLTPEQSHALWMKHKLAEGWRYGPVKDEERKEHPCMVPYEQLPLNQRTKDWLFAAICGVFRTPAQAPARAPAPVRARVTEEDVNAAIEETRFIIDGTTTIAVMTLRNGFKLLGHSACVDPALFDKAIGERMAFEDARRQIWALEGYLLATRRAPAV